MAEQSLQHLRDGDTLRLNVTKADDSRAVFTFVDTLNQGTLFDRPPSVFRNAAKEHRLFELQNASYNDALLGTLIIQDNHVDAVNQRRESELGGLVVHPGARGFRLGSLLTRLGLLHDLVRSKSEDWDSSYQAHFVQGNTDPEASFRKCGFVPVGDTVVHRGEIDASLEYMLQDGADGVTMKRVVFKDDHLPDLIDWYRHLQDNDHWFDNSETVRTRLDLSAIDDELDISVLGR